MNFFRTEQQNIPIFEKEPTPPDMLHPAAQEAAATFSAAIKKANDLEKRLAEVEQEYAVLKLHASKLEEMLDEQTAQKEQFQRYSVQIKTHLDGIVRLAIAANEKSLDAAWTLPDEETRTEVAVDAVKAVEEALIVDFDDEPELPMVKPARRKKAPVE